MFPGDSGRLGRGIKLSTPLTINSQEHGNFEIVQPKTELSI